MAIVINGSGTVTGLAVGGLPDGSVDSDTLASGIDKTSISDSGDATAMTIDSGERIGIGNTVAGTMNGVNSSILTIGTGSGHSGMTVYTGSTNEGTINFADDTSGTGTYKGMVRYDHNTNVLTLHSNATERIKINSTGEVTFPTQPCVSARATYTDIPVNTVTVITLDNERFDVGNNLASNTFTAPVTGKYLYTYTLYFTNVDTAATSLGVQVVTSNRQYENWFAPDHIANTDFYYTATSSQIANMDANDTLQFKAYCGGGAAQTDVHADSQISIALIA